MKKIPVFIILILALFSGTSFAWVNLALTAAELAAPYVLIGGVKYFLPSGNTPHLPNKGYADNYYIRRNSLGGYGGFFMNAAISIGTASLIDYVANHAASFPELAKGALKSNIAPPITTANYAGLKIGDLFTLADGSVARVTALRDVVGGNPVAPSVTEYRLDGGNGFTRIADGTITVHMVDWIADSTTPTYTPVTPSEFAKYLNDNINNQAPWDELDNLIKSAPNIVHFPDAEVIANAKEALASQAAQAAASNAATAKSALEAAQAAYNANPSPENKAALDAATKALNDALIAQQQTESAIDSATKPEPETVDPPADQSSGEYDKTIEAPVKKDLKTLITGFIASSPISSLVKSFTVSSSSAQSIFTVHCNMTNSDVVFDFGKWESFLAAAGTIFLSVAHAYAILLIFRGA